jgi:apolipoprotein N-acyltransferase
LGFAVAAVLLGFSNGRDLIPGVIWIAPGLMLALLRGVAPGFAAKALLLSGIVAGMIQWRGVVPMAPAISLAVAAALGLVLILPYLADRLLAPRLSPMLGLLVFPTAQVTLEYATGFLSPYATWGSFAYTQASFPIVLQIASLFGLWIVSFVVALAAPALALIIERRRMRSWREVSVALCAIVATVVFGVVRLAVFSAPPNVVQIKAVGIASKPSDLAQIIAVKSGCGVDDCRLARRDAEAQIDALVARSRAAARAGARLVVWSEVAAPVFSDREAELMLRLRTLARDTHSWLAPALFVVRPGQPLWANKVLMIDPQGNVIATHLKSKPVPGEMSIDGPDTLPLVRTSIGLIGLAICYDFDFPALARQAAGASIVVVPGSDWAEIDPLHTQMSALRAVENGYAVLRPSRQSASVIYDQYGRLLSRTAWVDNPKPEVWAEVPLVAVPTLYSKVGDIFAILSTVSLLVLVRLGLSNQRGAFPAD